MKLLLTLLLVLWGLPQAGAEEPKSWRYMTCPSDPLRQCRVIANMIEDPPKDVACRAQLESAMRAMDPLFYNGREWISKWMRTKEYWQAWKQWNDVKQACWQEPTP